MLDPTVLPECPVQGRSLTAVLTLPPKGGYVAILKDHLLRTIAGPRLGAELVRPMPGMWVQSVPVQSVPAPHAARSRPLGHKNVGIR